MWSWGHGVMWSWGHGVMWPCIPVVMWLCGHVVKGSCAHVVVLCGLVSSVQIPFLATTLTTSNQILHAARYYGLFELQALHVA